MSMPSAANTVSLQYAHYIIAKSVHPVRNRTIRVILNKSNSLRGNPIRTSAEVLWHLQGWKERSEWDHADLGGRGERE